VHNQLLCAPVHASNVSFSTNKVGPGKLLKAGVSRYRSGTEYATDHTHKRWVQLNEKLTP
jgi:hypothetical protein